MFTTEDAQGHDKAQLDRSKDFAKPNIELTGDVIPGRLVKSDSKAYSHIIRDNMVEATKAISDESEDEEESEEEESGESEMELNITPD